MSTRATLPEEQPRPHEGLAKEISSRLMALYKEHVGRGPNTVRTVIAEDLIVCVARDSLTKAERQLADAEREELVREFRRAFQGIMRDRCIAMVEELTGRAVEAFLSDHDPESDIATEVFLLDPTDDLPARES